MLFVELIRKKRDGGELSREEINFIISGYTAGQLPDYQVSAFLMASWLRGLSKAETSALTEAMLHSGKVLDLSAIPGPKVDKHSTGGVGDKTSLLLSPIVAACGINVPMVSGRGLGHTGGTLDKLEAIPGFNVNLSNEEFTRVLGKLGCAMMGQTAELAPADKLLYALRDVAATVENRSLICASIMSKKLAEGIDSLVLDVKTGSGAFMKTMDDSRELAELLVNTGESMGKQTVALITDMDQPLGRAVGNALEVIECNRIMLGRFAGCEDLIEVTLELAGWMVYLGGKAASQAEGKQKAWLTLRDGGAFKKFRELVKEQNGDVGAVDDFQRMPRNAYTEEIRATSSGFVSAIDCQQIGIAAIHLGAGRAAKEDKIDPAAGIVLQAKIGEEIEAGKPLCTLMFNSRECAEAARPLLEQAFTISQQKPEPRPLIHQVIQGKSV